jgi:hypothetical protein
MKFKLGDTVRVVYGSGTPGEFGSLVEGQVGVVTDTREFADFQMLTVEGMPSMLRGIEHMSWRFVMETPLAQDYLDLFT